jgi:hypothetical protein
MPSEAAAIKEEKEWKAQRDAQTLAEANVILGDAKRLKAAKKAATNLAKDAANELKGLLKVAGKLDDTVEGMKIVK